MSRFRGGIDLNDERKDRRRKAVVLILLLLLLLLLACHLGHGQEEHTVTIITEGSGSAQPSGDAIVEDGGDLEIRMVPDEGWFVSSVRMNGEDAGFEDDVLLVEDIRSDIEVRIVFSTIGGSFVILATSSAGGTISPSGETAVAAGGDAVFTATASGGFRFSFFQVDGARTETQGSEYVFSDVQGNHSIHAVFVPGSSGDGEEQDSEKGGLNVIVTSVQGTYVDGNGRPVSFEDTERRHLSDGDPFRLNGISPGVSQTVTLEVGNGTGIDMEAGLMIRELTGSQELANAMRVTVGTGSRSTEYRLIDLADSTIPIGTIQFGSCSTVSVTVSLPGESAGSDTIDRSISFRLELGACA